MNTPDKKNEQLESYTQPVPGAQAEAAESGQCDNPHGVWFLGSTWDITTHKSDTDLIGNLPISNWIFISLPVAV